LRFTHLHYFAIPAVGRHFEASDILCSPRSSPLKAGLSLTQLGKLAYSDGNNWNLELKMQIDDAALGAGSGESSNSPGDAVEFTGLIYIWYIL